MSSFATKMQSALESNGRRLSAYLCRVLTAALTVCPVFVAIMAVYWLLDCVVLALGRYGRRMVERQC